MTVFQRRLIILIDEWLGVALCCWCRHYHPDTFWPVLITFVIFVYGISYPSFWWRYDAWWRSKD